MGLFAKFIYSTPFGKWYKEYNKRKWEAQNAKTEKELFPVRTEFYKQFIKPNDLVFDVGANVGNRVEVFLNCGAKVVAIDPQPSCVEILRKKFGSTITVEQVGLGSEEGELEMHIASDSTVSTFDSSYIQETKDKFKYTNWTGTIRVPITTLENLIAKYGVPKFCKIDVEGFELQVLKGLHSQIPVMSIEYIAPERTDAAIECISVLKNISPTGLFNYSIGESMQWALENWMTFSEFERHLKTESFNSTSFGDIYFKIGPV